MTSTRMVTKRQAAEICRKCGFKDSQGNCLSDGRDDDLCELTYCTVTVEKPIYIGKSNNIHDFWNNFVLALYIVSQVINDDRS